MSAPISGFSNPNDPEEVAFWPEASLLGKEYYEISVPSMRNPTIKSGPRTEYCAFWDNYLPTLVHGTGEWHYSPRGEKD